jgi:hypothetical protein
MNANAIDPAFLNNLAERFRANQRKDELQANFSSLLHNYSEALRTNRSKEAERLASSLLLLQKLIFEANL